MPVRSLHSSVLRWPDAPSVDQAVRRWAQRLGYQHPGIVRIGYFGSYARGDAGVGSDLDLIVIVAKAEKPFAQRAVDWDVTDLPVPAEVFIYTLAEWQALQGRFARTVQQETIWVYSHADS
ncbi:nucleotidyltransferase domain-containing protein [Candidatus Acetothermia bacterium]|nr:nucleotidyltransferase domain-containing protein [Candidatus Acetothermia bacterium]